MKIITNKHFYEVECRVLKADCKFVMGFCLDWHLAACEKTFEVDFAFLKWQISCIFSKANKKA